MSELPDSDATYRGTPLLPGSRSAPWNIAGPQPALPGVPAGMTSPVLDAGCGIGAAASTLAALGHDVVGLDRAPAALGQTVAGARERALDVTVARPTSVATTGISPLWSTVRCSTR
ncbi:class I SAM-dependent methyltransferase [Amycolatopsis sp. NPDC023774]|uniref:class I SAM-dependent methyltransferase n=1 Tax=Amycolatopsis sp. NPDC023774 TaxID=3155015 RepID=UPI0033DCBF09